MKLFKEIIEIELSEEIIKKAREFSEKVIGTITKQFPISLHRL